MKTIIHFEPAEMVYKVYLMERHGNKVTFCTMVDNKLTETTVQDDLSVGTIKPLLVINRWDFEGMVKELIAQAKSHNFNIDAEENYNRGIVKANEKHIRDLQFITKELLKKL